MYMDLKATAEVVIYCFLMVMLHDEQLTPQME